MTFLEKCLWMKASKAINRGSSRSYKLDKASVNVVVIVDTPMLLIYVFYTLTGSL